MRLKDIEKKADEIRRRLSKQYGFKQSSYINWKIKDGYFFCLNTLHVVHTQLEVKPLFMDDLYWKIIYYGHKEMKFPDSLRGNGILALLSEKIWEESFPEGLRTDFNAEQYEQIMSNAFLKAETEIDSFLRKYPHPNLFKQFMSDNNRSKILTQLLVLINDEKYEEASQLAKRHIENKPHFLCEYVIENIKKNEYEFILDYCLEKMK